MHSRIICRRCERNVSERQSLARRSFFIPGARPRYAPDLPVRLEHILIDVAIDPKVKTARGTVTQRLKVISPGVKHLKLDQGGLNIEEVKVSGQVAKHGI